MCNCYHKEMRMAWARSWFSPKCPGHNDLRPPNSIQKAPGLSSFELLHIRGGASWRLKEEEDAADRPSADLKSKGVKTWTAALLLFVRRLVLWTGHLPQRLNNVFFLCSASFGGHKQRRRFESDPWTCAVHSPFLEMRFVGGFFSPNLKFLNAVQEWAKVLIGKF